MRQQRCPKASIKRPNARTNLTKSSIICGDCKIANHLKDMSPTDSPTSDHGHNGLRATAHLHMQISHMESSGSASVGLVPAVSSDSLVSPGTEGFGTFTSKDDDANRFVFACDNERLRHFNECLRAKSVVYLRAIYRDLGDAIVGCLVADVFELVVFGPGLSCSGFGHVMSLALR